MKHLYLTHPQVIQDPAVPVPQWQLSDAGRARIAALAAVPAFGPFDLIAASAERKAQDAAEILHDARGWPVLTRAALGENDRSATGYLPGPDFEAAADAFFANPDHSHRGWEKARTAQARIVGAVRQVISENPDKRILFVGHGAVGTLLRCHIAGLAINRAHDQPGNIGGCWFRFDTTLTQGGTQWTPIETFISD
ncbi:histidine phosphatase family protein [Yoonia sp. R2331]|uniref:histidine phosphatase family protein n=1 Tax=Yoonia sp. R2331 TaxID=3237238 RepID=UPI0034E50CAC